MDATTEVIKKVVIYTIRKKTGSEAEVLVFDHTKIPEVSPQVPAGTVEAGEGLVEAAAREFFEETGIKVTGRLKFIGNYKFHREKLNQIHDRHVFVLEGGHLAESWMHRVTGVGQDTALEFKFYWLPFTVAQESLQVGLGEGLKLFLFEIVKFMT